MAILSDALGSFSFGSIRSDNIKCNLPLIGHKEGYYQLERYENDHDKALAQATAEALANIFGAIYTDTNAKETIALYMPHTLAALENINASIIKGGL